MIQRTIYFLLFLLPLGFHAEAQKVKYKELFILLNAKQYEQADVFLKRYLRDNDDNPNAYLYMGSIYHDKSGKNDILLQTDLMLMNMDSAIFFYNLANKGMTEKEINRNEEYYEGYSRRNPRTGKFEITLSDVKFDLEKRIQQLNERKGKVKTLVSQYHEAELAYTNVNKAFIAIQKTYPGLKEFYLRSDQKLKEDLKAIIMKYDTFLMAFNDYKATAKLMGKTGYNQVLDPSDIQDFKKEGSTPSDFTKDDLKVWDYKRWAISNLDIIEKEVTPVLEHLISFDIEINKLRDKLIKDSISVKSDLIQLMDKLDLSILKKFDSDPLPMAVFDMKISEVAYSSLLIDNKPLKDSADVNLRIKCVKTEVAAVRKIDSLAGHLVERNIDLDEENYAHFITNAYGNLTVLKSLAKATKEFAEREIIKKEREAENTMQSLKWVLDGRDSIPLFSDALQQNLKFKPLVLSEEHYTAGLYFPDSLAIGYFYTVVSSHLKDVKANFTVDKGAFRLRNLPVTKGMSATDGKGQVYFVLLYGESKVEGKFPSTLAKIYRTDGLAWSNNYPLEMIPSELLYQSDTGELSIKMSDPSGGSKVVVIDKAGKVVN